MARAVLEGESGTLSAANVDATSETGESPPWTGGTGATLWWEWTPPAHVAGEVAAVDTEGSDFDTLLAVFEGAGALDDLVRLADNDDFTPDSGASRVTFTLREGATYYVLVDGYGGQRGSIELHWAVAAASANDSVAGRATLTGPTGEDTAENAFATAEPGEPAHGENPATGSLWWSWTAPDDLEAGARLEVDTAASDFDTVLAVYTGDTLDALTPVAANDDAGTGTRSSFVAFEPLPGARYAFAVDGSRGARGHLVLRWSVVMPVANDDFGGRSALAGAAGSLQAHNAVATLEPAEPDHRNGVEVYGSLWWRWTPPIEAPAVADVDTLGSDFDTVLAVYTGKELAKLTRIASADEGTSAFGPSRVEFRLEPAVEYQIAVVGYGSSSGRVQLNWRVLPLFANDAFEAMATLDGDSGTLETSNLGATSESDEPPHAGAGPSASLWWSWQPERAGTAILRTAGSSFDTLLAVYRGDRLDTLQPVAANDDSSGDGTSLVSFPADSGTTYQIAVDGYFGATGRLALAWAVVDPPPNDDFARRHALGESTGRVPVNTLGATLEAGERGTDEGRGGSIWWRWTAPQPGVARLSLLEPDFDSFLGVYSGSAVRSLAVVAEQEVGFFALDGFGSYLLFDVRAGSEYQIAVAGIGGAAGEAVLEWEILPQCAPPAIPQEPFPAAGARGLSGQAIELRWGGDAGSPPTARPKAIFGDDDRQEVYEFDDPLVVEAAASTVALIPSSYLTEEEDRFVVTHPESATEVYAFCPDERFSDQPVVASCSGFLVAEDLVATAGHCLDSYAECESLLLVFGYRMLSADTPALEFSKDQVYRCAGIPARKLTFDGTDWSLLRLDRPVPDHRPLRLRRRGSVASADPLVVIGHPLGLPLKVAGGALVVDSSQAPYFSADLDTFGGNSGSPVLNAATYTVEGIVVRGEDNLDFGEGDCLRALRCETLECLPAEVVRATEFADLVPADPAGLVYEVWFGPCGALVRVGETREARWTVDGPLESGRTHCWRVRATGDCGSAEGPVWSFAVGRAVNPFRRGDCNGDGEIDLTDALFHLRFTFLGEVNPPCRSACDVNGDGVTIGLGDALALVAFAYQGGPPPSAPYPACGVAAGETDLLLGCESAPAGCAP